MNKVVLHSVFCTILTISLLIPAIEARSRSYSAFGGIINNGRDKTVSSPGSHGDYEFVLSGASEGGDEGALRNTPLDRALMERQGFSLLGVEGSKDRRSEIWVRVKRSENHITISGGAHDVAYTVLTVYGSEVSFNIDDITVETDD